MAEPTGDVDEDGRPEGPVEKAVEKRKQKSLAIAGVAVGAAGLLFVILRGRSSSSATPAAGAAGSYSYPTVPTDPNTYSTGSGGTVDLSSLQSALTSLAQSEQTLSEQFATSTSGGTTVQTSSATPSPAPAPADPFAGYTKITSEPMGSVFSATKGTDVFANENGTLVPVVQGGEGPGGAGLRLPAWSYLPAHTQLYAGPAPA